MFGDKDFDSITAATVYDRAGDKVGSVGQLYLDDDTGKPSWVTVNTGFFGTSESFVPIDDSVNLNGDRLEVPFDKDQIKDAPRVDNDRHLDPAEEEELYRHYGRDSGRGRGETDRVDVDVDVDRDRDGDGDGDRDRVDVDRDRVDVDRDRNVTDAETMTASEERLNVGKEQVEAGRARLRKHVTTEQQTVTVPVEKEVLTVEREAVSGDSRSDARIGDDDGEVEEVVLREERPVVSKEVHDVERVNVGKETVTEQHQVSDEVKKEHIEVEGDGQTGRDTDTVRDTETVRDEDRRL